MSEFPSILSFPDLLDRPWTERLEAIRLQGTVPGTLGPYRLLRLLGRGGMGAVHLAERADGRFERQVAIKLLDLGLTLSREASALARLDHPNIAGILDAGCAPDGRHYLVLQYVEGNALAATTLSSPEAVARCFSALASALSHAHERGILHRDIKPSNILINPQGDPVLIDFSAATDARPNQQDATKTMYRAWTPNFASPEQIAGEAGTVQSDIYSLGLLLRGVLNSKDPTPLEFDLRQIAAKASEEIPSLRYGSAQEMAQDLEAALARKPTLAQRPRRHLAWAQKIRQHPRRFTGLVLLLAVACGAFIGWQQRRERELDRRVRALASLSSPTIVDSGSDDPRGVNSRALLSGIEEWSKLREEYGSKPAILEGLFSVTAGYGHLLVGPTASRTENLGKALPYLTEAMRISDAIPDSPQRPCEIRGHRSDSRIALANAYLTKGDLSAASRFIQEARAVVSAFPDTRFCNTAKAVHRLELDAVESRILFAQKRWDELIPIRRNLLLRRETVADRARDEAWPDAIGMRVAAEHARTSLGWALHASGNNKEGYEHYSAALTNLESLHRRAPSMRAITFRLGKFHGEAAQICTTMQDDTAAIHHSAKSKEFHDAFAAH